MEYFSENRTNIPSLRNPQIPSRPAERKVHLSQLFAMASLIARSLVLNSRRGVQLTSVRFANKSKFGGFVAGMGFGRSKSSENFPTGTLEVYVTMSWIFSSNR